MFYEKKLGVLVHPGGGGGLEKCFSPPLAPETARRLFEAFLEDFFARLSKLKNIRGTVYHQENPPDRLRRIIPKDYGLIEQTGATWGERMSAAFENLLGEDNRRAVTVGPLSPDLPVQYIKRAYSKLKHKDVVIGPDANGGCYLFGLKNPVPGIFAGLDREDLRETLARIENKGLSLSLLPLWYSVGNLASLVLLNNLIKGKRMNRSSRLPATGAVLDKILAADR